jgi:hypothetical protein
MVFFCPECLYSLGINKKTTSTTDKIMIDSIDDFIKLFQSNKFDINVYQIDFTKDELSKNKKYSKLSSQDKSKIDKLFTSSLFNAEQTCTNCGYKSDIVETIKLHEYNTVDVGNNIRSLNDNKLLSMNPILPRSKDYICKNLDCLTNKKKDTPKEVVWIRTPKNFNIEHICTVCYYSWT